MFLSELGGLCEDLLGDGYEMEELEWRIKAEGARQVWLPRGQALRQWSLHLLAVSADEKNQGVLQRMKQFPRRVSGEWGVLREGEAQEFAARGPAPEILEKAFAPASGLSHELRSKEMSVADRTECLVAWGRHCLVNGEHLSARPAFEDARILSSKSIEVLTGLGHCAARRGGVASMGHYASLVLAQDPRQSEALEMMGHLAKESA
jgi:hypothetical protein